MLTKKISLVLCFILLGAMILSPLTETSAQYKYFGHTTRGDYDTQTLLPLAARADTGYSSVLWTTFDIGTLRLQLNVTTVSTSDSLDVQIYSSADDSTYTQITSPAFTAVSATGSQVITITNAPKYIKAKYLNRGSAVSNIFSLKAAAKP